MTLQIVFGLSCLSLIIWCALLLARGGFWRATPAGPLSASAREAADWPAVAVVVPARNEVDVIGEAVSSLVGQDYAGTFHVIVVDDHSTDGTADPPMPRARPRWPRSGPTGSRCWARGRCRRAGRARSGRSRRGSRRCARWACRPTTGC